MLIDCLILIICYPILIPFFKLIALFISYFITYLIIEGENIGRKYKVLRIIRHDSEIKK